MTFSFRIPAGEFQVFGYGAAEFFVGKPIKLEGRPIGKIIEAYVTEDGEFIEATVWSLE